MTPQLRFPEFNDEWQVKKLGDIFEYKRTNSLSRAELREDGTVGNIHYGDIHKFLPTLLDTNEVNLPKIINPSSSTNEAVKVGDVIIADASEDYADIGKAIEIVQTKPNETIYAGLHTFLMRPTQPAATGFFGMILKTNRLRKQLMRLATGISVLGISKGNVSSVTVRIPSKPEQEKIADFLTAVDERIAVGEKKLELLETYKRGITQKIFSQQVRFKDDNSNPYPDWEEKKLGDVFIERDGKGGALENMLSVTIKNGIVPFSTIDRKDNSPANKSNYKKVVTGDIAYNSMRMWQGASGVSGYDGIVSPAYTVITPKPGNISTFWGYYFKLPNVIFIFERYSQGLTSDTWNLKFKQLSEISLYAPVEKEQQKIANFLTTLDDKITAEKSKLTAARQFKKALLQRMFV